MKKNLEKRRNSSSAFFLFLSVACNVSDSSQLVSWVLYHLLYSLTPRGSQQKGKKKKKEEEETTFSSIPSPTSVDTGPDFINSLQRSPLSPSLLNFWGTGVPRELNPGEEKELPGNAEQHSSTSSSSSALGNKWAMELGFLVVGEENKNRRQVIDNETE